MAYGFVKFSLLPFLLLQALCSLAEPIVLGKKLPPLLISEGGDLYLDQLGQRQYRPWSTQSLLGKRKIIQYMPGRLSSRENLHLNSAAYAIDHPDRCRTVSIVNYTDAIPGTWIFIEPEMGRNKKITPLCDIVLDKSGAGQAFWGLPLNKAVTIVTNEHGTVEFFFAGKLSDKQVEQIIALTNPPGLKVQIDPNKPDPIRTSKTVLDR